MFSWIFNRRHRRTVVGRKRLGVEQLEGRELPAVLSPSAGALGEFFNNSATNVYVESNNPAAGQNAILAFHSNPATGALTQFGSFPTGGTGELNLPKAIGPDDGDHQVVTSPDGTLLYAVNEGSDSITAFRIQRDRDLVQIGTVSSGGVEPDGLTIAGDRLYVANRGNATSAQAGTIAPNINGFNIDFDGSLAPMANSTVSLPVGDGVTSLIATPNGRLLFAQVASLSGAPDGNTIDPFQIEWNGTLRQAPGGPQGASANPSVQLGIAFNPNLPIIYAGLTGTSQVGVYTYAASGRLTFAGSFADAGSGPCWCAVSADGRFLYVANTGSDAVGVYSLADPLKPAQIQEFALGGPTIGPGGTAQTAVFELALAPSGNTLYVIGQNTSPDGTFPQGNQLHTLAVAADGTVSEPVGPVIFNTADVPADAHPQGIAVVAEPDHRHDDPFGEYAWDPND
jgi:DNA-binding beta-propeller fold protein YncE